MAERTFLRGFVRSCFGRVEWVGLRAAVAVGLWAEEMVGLWAEEAEDLGAVVMVGDAIIADGIAGNAERGGDFPIVLSLA